MEQVPKWVNERKFTNSYVEEMNEDRREGVDLNGEGLEGLRNLSSTEPS